MSGTAILGKTLVEEDVTPGTGGNLNSQFSGWGEYEKEASDVGYDVGHFPKGAIPTGAEENNFRLADSKAFTGLRGVARSSFPFDPNPHTDHDGVKVSKLADNFQASQLLASGRPRVLDAKRSSLSSNILNEFEAGTSTFNSLPNAETAWGSENFDAGRSIYGSSSSGSVYDGQLLQNISQGTIPDQFRETNSFTQPADLPLTPFHKVYPDWGNGKVDYGFSDPGSEQQNADIVRAYNAVLPQGQLAGTKKDLMPVFSGINQDAVEQRPITQSLGKLKNTLYLGGFNELPDDLRIDPLQALGTYENTPADMVETTGELKSAYDKLGADAFGAQAQHPAGKTRVVGSSAPTFPSGFYDHLTSLRHEPLAYDGGDRFAPEVASLE